MVRKSNNFGGMKTCIPVVVLIGFGLLISSCWDNNADANLGEGDVAYGNEELITETTSMLGNSKENDKVIANLKDVKGQTLLDHFSFIDSVFKTQNPEFVKAMLFDGGSLKSGLSKDFVFKVNDGTTIFDLYLDEVIGANNEYNNRTTNKFRRDKWSKDSGLLALFFKSMMENKEDLNTAVHPSGPPVLLRYLKRLTQGNWHHCFDELMKIFDILGDVKGLPDYIPLIYDMSKVVEDNKVSSAWDSFWGNDYRERWGGYVLKIINKVQKDGVSASEGDKGKYTFSDKDIIHKAYINFITDDWTHTIDKTSVVSKLTTIFGKNEIPANVKALYIDFLPKMIATKDSKTYAAQYNYIISSLGVEACNVKTITAAVKAKKPDLEKKLLAKSTEVTISSIMSSPEYDGCANIIDFYAEKSYFPGKSQYEEFLNMLKKRLELESFKSALKVAQDKCVDERSDKEAIKCIGDARANVNDPVSANIP